MARDNYLPFGKNIEFKAFAPGKYWHEVANEHVLQSASVTRDGCLQHVEVELCTVSADCRILPSRMAVRIRVEPKLRFTLPSGARPDAPERLLCRLERDAVSVTLVHGDGRATTIEVDISGRASGASGASGDPVLRSDQATDVQLVHPTYIHHVPHVTAYRALRDAIDRAAQA